MDNESASMTQPTVYLVINGSAIAYEESGEVLESVDFDTSGQPRWADAGICDDRGGGGAEGYRLLLVALNAAEENARRCGLTPVRVPMVRD